MSRSSPLDSHHEQVSVENARFLLDNGEPMDSVAARLGTTVGALEKALARRKVREDHAESAKP